MRPFAVTHYFGQRSRGARVLYKNDEARMTNDERMTKIRMTKRSIRVAPAAWAPLLLCGADSVRGQYKKKAPAVAGRFEIETD